MSYQQLRSFEIRGYKSIQHQTVNLEQMNVLIGQNGAGKSNFISAFKFLRNIIEGRLKNTSVKTGAENLLYYGSKQTKDIYINLDFKPNVYDITLQSSDNDSLFVSTEHVGFWGDGYSEPYREIISISEDESRLEKMIKNKKIAKYVYEVLKEWRVYHFHDTSESAGVKKYAPMVDNKFLFEDASNLAPFLYTMRFKEEEFYERTTRNKYA